MYFLLSMRLSLNVVHNTLFSCFKILFSQDQISADCERIDILVRKEPPHRRQNVKHRYEQLIQETRSLNALLAKHQRQQSQQAEQEDERAQLLSRQFTANDNQVRF